MKQNNVGCLILHGFNGSRKEVASLNEKLKENGFKTSVPTLSGHDSTKKALSRAKYSDWIKSADKAIEQLSYECEKIVIIGFSMGGLIAANLYQKHEVESIVFVNTPIYYMNFKQKLKNLMSDFGFHIRKYFDASKGSTFKSLIEFVQLVTLTKPLFAAIECSSMVCQTLDDDTVNPKSAKFIYSEIKGNKILKKHKTGGHMVFNTKTGDEIGENICGFLQEIIEKDEIKLQKDKRFALKLLNPEYSNI